MSYINWNSTVNRAVRQSWLPDHNLYTFIRDLEQVQFALQTERTNGLAILSKLQLGPIKVGSKTQFPDDEFYVKYDACDYPSLFRQVRGALNYKPPENAFMINTESGRSAVNDSHKSSKGKFSNSEDRDDNDASKIKDLDERSKFEKAMVSYFAALQKIRDNFENQCAIFDRATFESHYNLKWSGDMS